jgi:transposase
MSELEAILDRVKASLTQEEYLKIHAALETLLFLTKELGKKSASLKRLKDMLFGATTEKTQQVLANALKSSGMDAQDGQKDDGGKGDPGEKTKPPGHGRNGADAYTGGQQVCVPHESLKKGDSCPQCRKGTLYDWTPGWIVRVTGQAPLSATVYKQQKLRCNLCSTVFSAKLPDGLDDQEKYDARSAAMIALLKYGSGLPFNRLERLQGSLGIPLPASTQWEIVDEAGRDLRAAFEELLRQAAQGQVVHNDDTTMKILDLAASESEDGRKGVFTSGIVSTGQGQKIAVFFTGRNHAGENLAELLKRRARGLDKPIQMCDALSRNMPEDLKTIVSNCLAHGRRKFTDVAASFPEEVAYVLGLLGKVYGNDARAKAGQMSDEQWLALHQAESGPLMAELETWMTEQIDRRRVEPNSALGEAIAYMQKHWPELTLFLREPGAPLDNNICERALKKAILHRKNAYFYKTQNGARVGDLYMSLIHTCELNDQNPFEYLTELQEHAKEAAARPELWMPWNYRDVLAATANAGN